MAGIPPASSPNGGGAVTSNYLRPLFLVTMLFFMWGFITCMNDILIPKLQQVFTLQHWQAMLIQTAFFGAYFIISLIYFIFSITKGDPIVKIGYKNGIIAGLLVAAVGCALFYPAAGLASYPFFLLALFVLASGITLLQIAANPYVTILGSPEGASSRLNLTQAFNSLGTTIAPVIGGYLIFDSVSTAAVSGAESVQMPYIGLAVTLIVIAIIFRMSKLPAVTNQIEEGESLQTTTGIWKFRHLLLGIACIFAYVGGEVAIGSALINFIKLPHIGNLDESSASQYLAIFWGGAMVGRFFGALALAQFRQPSYRILLMAMVALLSFLTIWLIYDMQIALIVLALIAINVVVLIFGKFIPSRTLGLFAASVLVLLIITILGNGVLAMWSVIAIGLFNSIMFPTIFALAIKGLGNYAGQGSSLLVMAIVGGAIVPPLQGWVADLLNIQYSFIIPFACYLYIVYYGFFGYHVKHKEAHKASL